VVGQAGPHRLKRGTGLARHGLTDHDYQATAMNGCLQPGAHISADERRRACEHCVLNVNGSGSVDTNVDRILDLANSLRALTLLMRIDQGLIERFAQTFGAGDCRDGDPTVRQQGPERLLTPTMLKVPEQSRRALRILAKQKHQPLFTCRGGLLKLQLRVGQLRAINHG
jgi:hypothetical protein